MFHQIQHCQSFFFGYQQCKNLEMFSFYRHIFFHVSKILPTIFMCKKYMKCDALKQMPATYGTCAALDTPGNFYWHEKTLKFVVVGTLNDLKA